MKKDTKIYSDFIKKNNVKVSKEYFEFNGKRFSICKTGKGYEVTMPDGLESDNGTYISKKSAVYFTIKNL